jgi:hypothetical protein
MLNSTKLESWRDLPCSCDIKDDYTEFERRYYLDPEKIITKNNHETIINKHNILLCTWFSSNIQRNFPISLIK